MRKSLVIFTCILMACALLFCSCGEAKEQTYTSDAGISVTMCGGMTKKDIVSQTYYLLGTNVIFTALKESKSVFTEAGMDNLTISEYVELLGEANKTTYEQKESDGIHYFTYKATTDREYFYFATVLENDDAFWLCNFACVSSKQETYEASFLKWAKTIKV